MKPVIDVCIPSKRGVPKSLLNKVRDDTNGKIHVSRISPLALARMELIKKVNTDIFLFLDDDIEYTKGLIQLLYGYFSKNIGAIQGSISPYGLGEKWDEALNTFKLKAPKYDVQRIMLHNTLIKTSLVKDWNPSPTSSGCEDWHLTLHIRKKGYVCMVVPAGVGHRISWSKTRRNAIWFGRAYVKMVGNFPFKYVLKLFVVIVKHILTLPLHSRLSIYTVYQNLCIIFGMLL